MSIEPKNKFHLVKILYIVENGVEHDYHVMPFELMCDRVHITDYKDSLKHYLEIKPNVVMIHVVEDYHLCEEIIKKIKQVDEEPAFLILASQELRDAISDSSCANNVTLLFEPIQLEDMEKALENIVEKMRIIYFMENKISFEPHNSLLIHNNKHIELTTKENKLLSYLIENSNRIVSYDEIENYVWDNMYMNRNTLTSIISNIRKKAGNANFIKNYSNQGYKVATENIFIK